MMEKENVEGYFSKFVKVLKNVTDKITSLIAGIFKEPSKKLPNNQEILNSLQQKIGEYLDNISSEEDNENRESGYKSLMKEIDDMFVKIKANLCGKYEPDIYISILEKVSILCGGKITESSSKQQDNEILKLFQDIAKKILLILCRQDFQDDKYTKYLSIKDNLSSVSNVFNNEIDFKSLDDFYVLYQSIIDKISEKKFKNDEKNDFETIRTNSIPIGQIESYKYKNVEKISTDTDRPKNCAQTLENVLGQNRYNEKIQYFYEYDEKRKTLVAYGGKDEKSDNDLLQKAFEILESVPFYRQDEIRYDAKNQCLYACYGNDKTLLAYWGTDEKFSIPEGVTCIGEDAFLGNKSLKFIDFPESLRSIEKGAFSGCSELMYLKFPSKLCNIGDRAFAGCEKLIAILLLASITTIGETIFWDGKNYKVVFLECDIPDESLKYQLKGYIRVLGKKEKNS